MDTIIIAGLLEHGVHGVLPEERERAQPFEVYVELGVDLAAAGASDRLDDTVDYGGVCEAIRLVIAKEHYALLERIATRIVEVCRATDPRVRSVTVEVRKLEPPVAATLDHVAVRIER
ncbi:MAG TPA: dihydroneopterin aldolase [Acidimicrobiia bacterium]|nr:dihydroneopterin aldolase [Acidimicrobiia bacterium]